MALSEEHRQIEDMLARILASGEGAAGIWARLREAGLLGLILPESQGGAELGLPEMMLIARVLGRNPLPLPWLGSEVIAAPLLAELAPGHAALALGQTLALAEKDGSESVIAEAVAEGWRLSGQKRLVLGAGLAEGFLVTAKTANGAAIFWTHADAVGLRITPYAETGLGPAGDLWLDGLVCPPSALLAQDEAVRQALEEAHHRARLAICAEMVGGIEALLELTTAYLKTRRQFGKPLSEFQALQHAATEIFIEQEQAKSMLDYGLGMMGGSGAARDLALSAMKLRINRAARIASEMAVQLHGGIGMTQEARTGQIFARLAALRILEGDEISCRRQMIESDLPLIA